MPSVDRDTFQALSQELTGEIEAVAGRFAQHRGWSWNYDAYRRQGSYCGETTREIMNFGMDLYPDGEDGGDEVVIPPVRARILRVLNGSLAAGLAIMALGVSMWSTTAGRVHAVVPVERSARIHQDTSLSVTGTSALISDAAV